MTWTVTAHDLFLVLFLAFLEGVLSVDNAVVLALVTRHLPAEQHRRALTYGLGGALTFRLLALGAIRYLMNWRWLRFVGGAYLVFIAAEHLIRSRSKNPEKPLRKLGFWKTVVLIEVMDIAFAIDSILAAVALSNKFWIVFTGGMLGVIMMRLAATFFIKLLKRFPHFESSAYLMVGLIGIKMTVEGFHISGVSFESSSNPAFWIFWVSLAGAFGSGFRRKYK